MGRYTRPRAGSALIGGHALGEPLVKVSPGGGSFVSPGRPMSQAQANLPVITSKARIAPDGSPTEYPSVTQPPIIATLPMIIGADVRYVMPSGGEPRPRSRELSPLSPK